MRVAGDGRGRAASATGRLATGPCAGGPPVCASSTATTGSIVGKRFAGSFASARSMTAATSAGSSGATERRGGGAAVRISATTRTDSLCLHGSAPVSELVRHDAPRELVRAPVERLAAELLGGHVERRPEDDALAGERLARGHGAAGQRLLVRRVAREAEVEDAHAAVVPHDDVLRLDVAVNEPEPMRGGEDARDAREAAEARREVEQAIDGVRA